MEIGETVSAVAALQTEGKCVICDKAHGKPKRAEVKPVAPTRKAGWKRDEPMAGKFESSVAKSSIYPTGFPPPYRTEGHHCLA
jgi:hypothetical protein